MFSRLGFIRKLYTLRSLEATHSLSRVIGGQDTQEASAKTPLARSAGRAQLPGCRVVSPLDLLGPKGGKACRSARHAASVKFKAKDIFRASQLPLLGVSNSHVQKDQKKIAEGSGISPILLVRDSTNGKVIIADGYHRLCAVYTFDEDAWIPCKIV